MAMKTIWMSVACMLMLNLSNVEAQEYAFKVLVNKGKNEVKVGTNWQIIKVGSSLNSVDELKVSENSYVGLVHKTGKPLELKQAGKYKVSDLSAKVSGGSSVLTKYTDFILSSNTQKTNSLHATGAVTRGTVIPLFLPSALQSPLIYNDEIIINWDTDKISGPYIVRFNSLFDDELAKFETMDNSIKINLSDTRFVNEDNILVIVISKLDMNKASEKYTLKRLSKADKERIKISLNEISSSTQEATAINKLVLAGFYEQNGLLIDATTTYLEAIKLAPDVPDFKEQYNNFLLRNKLKAYPVEKK